MRTKGMFLGGAAKRSGMTLVEVLCAVAIIGVLLAVLLAALNKVWTAGDLPKCASNLRQLQMAYQGYVADHNWLLPDKSPANFYPYIGLPTTGIYADTVFTCPSLQRNAATKSIDVNHRNYSINIYATSEKTENNSNSFLRIRNPAKMLLFTEGALQSSQFTAPDGQIGNWYLSDTRLEQLDEVFFPHNGRQNAVFADGSVRLVDRTEFYQNGKYNVPFWLGY